MSRTLMRLAMAGFLLLPAVPTLARAQTATPEGTVITNTATASFTDANSNTYTNVTASAAVTVGFLAGPNPSTASATGTPAAGSTGNTVTFTLTNSGNGTDNFQLSENGHAGITVTNYNYNGTSYASLAALNTALALAGNSLAQNAAGTLILTYSVATGTGGTSIPLTITQTSVRTNTASASATVTFTPPASRSVSVTPDGATVSQLPRGTVYTYTYTITNTGNSSDSYAVAATVTSGVAGSVTIVSVNGVAGTTSATGTLAAGASTSMDVTYLVNNEAPVGTKVPAGTTAQIILTATSNTLNTVSNPGDLTVTVIRAAVTMTKVAYKDDKVTAIAASTVVPGQYLQYKITVTNATGATVTDASSIQVTDSLPAQVTYQSVTADAAGWTFSGTSTVTANLAGTLAPGASRFFWIRVLVK